MGKLWCKIEILRRRTHEISLEKGLSHPDTFMGLERFEGISRFLFLMANQISKLAVQGVYQRAEINERHKVEIALLFKIGGGTKYEN